METQRRFDQHQPRTYSLHVQGPIHELHRAHAKSVELRVAYPWFARIQQGDSIRFNNDRSCQREVVQVDRFTGRTYSGIIAQVREQIDLSLIDPRIPPEMTTIELVEHARRYLNPADAVELGILALHLK